ncbi:MAG: GGDEF domain-containing response regulator [Planctomycetota bacterium]|jgi:diguanylate cyclase (GGDEF)-like protein
MRVLIIDDSPDAVAIATARLKKDDLEVISASDGPAGMEAAAAERPDLILLDVAMPGMSGFDVIRQLKGDPDLCMIPVIFLTAMDDTEQKVEGLNLGAVDYVTKPFDAFELRARVQAALRTKRFADMLAEHAHIDPLTELPNRRALMEDLQKEWSRMERHGGSLSLIMADVDHFKHVNDTYGHSVGDRVLKAVAAAIDGQCRKIDIAARYGGEEFAILAPNQVAGSAMTLADRCREAVEQTTVSTDAGRVQVTISMGVADSTDAGTTVALVELADRRLYDAKNAGRNVVRCHVSPVPL